jgi:cytoskeletal protein CcmA (bactofilin family)/DNA-directed RNA polymerase subunit RPC12/RpoP
MPATKQDKVLVACPHCGHQQPEPRAAFSTNCKKCGQHFHVQEALKPARKSLGRALDLQRIVCFECGAELDVPTSAESTMCKRCSRYLDLHDYHITNAVAKNFKTKGRFTVEPKGYVFNTETVAGEVIIRGKFHGKLAAERSLTIYSTAEIKGSLAAAHLIIPAENHFRWPDVIKAGSAEIAGELAANVHATGAVTLKSTARFFGNVDAANLVVEAGAVVVGKMNIGSTAGNKQIRLL